MAPQARYDHRSKAGNAGDLVKHAALAGLAATAAEHAGSALRYADTFAGFAYCDTSGSPGARVAAERVLAAPTLDRAPWGVRWLAAALARPDEPASARYPGSAAIVRDVCRSLGRDLHMTLWDTSDEAVLSLQGEFADEATVLHRAARVSDAALREADLVLIDPPGLAPDYAVTLEMLEAQARAGGRMVLVWLPVLRDEPPELAESDRWAVSLDALCRRIDWGDLPAHGRLVGCRLIALGLSDHAAGEIDRVASWFRACFARR